MHSSGCIARSLLRDEQLTQYTVQFLQNKEEANKIFEEVKALKVLDHLKSIVTLDKKEVSDKDFKELLISRLALPV